ncbi:MFS transporter, putative quinolone resistance protein [Bifidobacterium magnum]|uniref:MFS transporter, putative quinolone resistance protein n=1 Tax=Bifidobacterium magnum TaxID=1692 RepID=A0A087B7Z0_9BIFI|nr:MFS transporter, putative quinolone resistance protein [Bifidobacterium magnum]
MVFIMIATFFFMCSNMLGQTIIAGYAGSMGANGFVMGLIAALMSLTSLFCRPIAGNLADKTNKRRLAFIGAILYAVADLAYAFSPNEGVLMAARVLNGLGFACGSVCLATWLSMLLPISRMGAGMGLYGMTNAIAQAIGPAIGIRCSQTIGFRWTYIIAAVMAAFMVVSVIFVKDPGKPLLKRITKPEPLKTAMEDVTREFLDNPPSERPITITKPGSAAANTAATDTADAAAAQPRGLNRFVETRVIPIAVIFMMFAIPYFANQAFLVEYCAGRHLPVSASLFFPLYAIAILMLRVLMRNWFDTKSFLFFLIMSSIGDVVMLLALTVMKNDWIMLIAAIGMAFGYGIMSSVTQSQAVLVAGKARSGMANTTYYMGIDLGMSIGPLIGGVLFAVAPMSMFYMIMLVTMPVAWIIFACFSSIINIDKHPIRSVHVVHHH